MVWAAAIPWIASAVGGIASLFGAKKTADAQEQANAESARIAAETNRLNYQRWLESQGVGPDGQPINTRMPRYQYAQVGRPTRRLVPRGTARNGRITQGVVNPAIGMGAQMLAAQQQQAPLDLYS